MTNYKSDQLKTLWMDDQSPLREMFHHVLSLVRVIKTQSTFSVGRMLTAKLRSNMYASSLRNRSLNEFESAFVF